MMKNATTIAIKSVSTSERLLYIIDSVQKDLITKGDVRHALNKLLDFLIELSDSQYGFICEVKYKKDSSPYLKSYATTNLAWDETTRRLFEEKHKSGFEFHDLDTLYGWALKNKKPIISDDPANDPRAKGLPKGHPPLLSFIGIPIIYDNVMLGYLGLANKDGGYDESIIDLTKPLFNTICNLVKIRSTELAKEKIEEKSVYNEEFLKILIEHSTEPVAVLDRNLRYLHVSSEWRKKTILDDVSKLQGTYIYDSMPYIPQECRDMHKRSLEGSTETLEEIYYPSPTNNDGWFNCTSRPWYNPSGAIGGVVIFCEDITKYKKVQAKLEKTISNLKNSNDELERFAYICSHDLQEPLRTISNFAYLLQDSLGFSGRSKNKKYLNYITDGTKRMHCLIKDILIYSKSSSCELRCVAIDFIKIIEEVEILLESMIKENNAKLIYIKNPVMVKGDRTSFIQLMQNLISNAIKFKSSTSPIIEISFEKKNNWNICVKDNGIGIEKKYFNQVFSMFTTLHSKSDYEGSGIGLGICKKIIERHGGKISIQSEGLNKGTCFHFTLNAAANGGISRVRKKKAINFQ